MYYKRWLPTRTMDMLRDERQMVQSWLDAGLRIYGETTGGKEDADWDRERIALINAEIARRELPTPTRRK
jgi:hypothetical protein